MRTTWSPPSRRNFLATSAAAGAISLLLKDLAAADKTVADQPPLPDHSSSDGGRRLGIGIDDNAVRPFRVDIPEELLVDLRRRVLATRWPDRETVNDQSQGIQLGKLKPLVEYWGTGYDWRRTEAKLNALPQFLTRIDGLDIHFIHVPSGYPNALPLIMTHGWPGSVLELLKTVGPLTNPTAHGGRAEDAFHLVMPSMPGFGFSEKPTDAGWVPTASREFGRS
jgi:hypothetical protein